jgi:excisionase family DNA binding protein
MSNEPSKATRALVDALYRDPKLNERQAAEYLGIAPATLTQWRCTGRHALPFLRVGRLIRYRVSDLDAWLETRVHRHSGDAA